MNSFAFLLLRSAKNSFFELRRNPLKLAMYSIIFLIFGGVLVASILSRSAIGAVNDIVYMKGIVFAFFAIFLFIYIKSGLSHGNAFFGMDDANLMFVSPIKPRMILIYGIVRMMRSMLLSSVFILFQGANLHYFGIRAGGLAELFIGYLLAVSVMQILSIYIYIATNSSPARQRFVRILLALLHAPLAVYTVCAFIGAGSINMAAVRSILESPYISYTPLTGWAAAGISAFMIGDSSRGMMFFGMIILLGVVFAALIYVCKADYYEDVLVASATLYERKRGMAEDTVDGAGFGAGVGAGAGAGAGIGAGVGAGVGAGAGAGAGADIGIGVGSGAGMGTGISIGAGTGKSKNMGTIETLALNRQPPASMNEGKNVCTVTDMGTGLVAEQMPKMRMRAIGARLGGHGASVFFFKHLREDFRANRFGIWGAPTIAMTACAAIIAYLLKKFAEANSVYDAGIPSLIIVLSFMMLSRIFFIGVGRGLIETHYHYIFMAPDKPFIKIIWNNLEAVLKAFVDGTLIFVAVGIAAGVGNDTDIGANVGARTVVLSGTQVGMGSVTSVGATAGIGGTFAGNAFFVIAMAVAAYTFYNLMLISANYVFIRFTGINMNENLLVFLYMLAILIIMAPGVAVAIYIALTIAARQACAVTTALAVLSFWELIVAIACLWASKGILHNCDIVSYGQSE